MTEKTESNKYKELIDMLAFKLINRTNDKIKHYLVNYFHYKENKSINSFNFTFIKDNGKPLFISHQDMRRIMRHYRKKALDNQDLFYLDMLSSLSGENIDFKIDLLDHNFKELNKEIDFIPIINNIIINVLWIVAKKLNIKVKINGTHANFLSDILGDIITNNRMSIFRHIIEKETIKGNNKMKLTKEQLSKLKAEEHYYIYNKLYSTINDIVAEIACGDNENLNLSLDGYKNFNIEKLHSAIVTSISDHYIEALIDVIKEEKIAEISEEEEEEREVLEKIIFNDSDGLFQFEQDFKSKLFDCIKNLVLSFNYEVNRHFEEELIFKESIKKVTQ